MYEPLDEEKVPSVAHNDTPLHPSHESHVSETQSSLSENFMVE